jgi:hypothetical protein
MSGALLFEHHYRANKWEVKVTDEHGAMRASFWPHYRRRDTGEWAPCGKGSGFTMPLESLAELTAALMAFHGIDPPDELQRAA